MSLRFAAGSLWCSVQTGSKTTRFAQTSFCPDPSGPALLGASTRGPGIPNSQIPNSPRQNPEYLKPQGHAMACPCFVLGFGIWYFGLPRPGWAEQRRRRRDKGWRCLSEASLARPPPQSSSAGCPVAKRRGPRLRVAFLLGTFLWRSKEKCLARRGETRPAELRRARAAGARPGSATTTKDFVHPQSDTQLLSNN